MYFNFVLINLLLVICVYSYPQSFNQPICPKIKGRREYRYHTDSNQCYIIGTQGPCQANQMFYATTTDTIYGLCDCNQSSEIPLVWHRGNCFKTYEQAFCNNGQWLIFDMNRNPICSPNICGNSNNLVVHNGQRVELHSRCGNNNFKISFLTDDVLPSCNNEITDFASLAPKKLRCKAGSRLDVEGKCRRAIQTNFGK